MIWKRRGKGRGNFPQLSTKDTHNGLETLIKIAQHQSFSLELANLLSQRSITCNSKILSLSPFIDKKNILRVGGRFKNAKVHPDAKHQVILLRHHHLSKLIILDIHYKDVHIGREDILCLFRNKYCILACRGVIRKILANCFYCKRVNLRPKSQIMANLPKVRLLIYGKPFASTGVNYLGLFLVKHSNSIISTCVTTGAIPLELTGDLSTDSFILSPRRFISRRDHVKIMKSKMVQILLEQRRNLKVKHLRPNES